MNVSNYTQLQELVNQNQLEIIRVIALPRANGTALHLALTQASEVQGQLNEPFYYPDLKSRKWNYRPSEKPIRTFEEGCAFILERYKEAVKLNTGKIQLVIHDLSSDLSDEEFKNLANIDRYTIFTLRDPLKLALSQLTRFVNDKLSQPAGNKIKTKEALFLLDDNTNMLEFMHNNPGKVSEVLVRQILGKEKDAELIEEDLKNARKKVIDHFIEEYKIAWENLYHFWTLAKSDPTHPSYSVFDGGWLFDQPEKSLKELTQSIGSITYTTDMIHNWRKGIGQDFKCVITRLWGELAQTNAWNGPSRNSTGIVRQPDSIHETLSLESFPKEIQKTIHNMFKFYQEMKGERQSTYTAIQLESSDICYGIRSKKEISRVPNSIFPEKSYF